MGMNEEELEVLRDELARTEHILNPGNVSEFNLILGVFSMLFGEDLVHALVCSPKFNLAYAVPGDDGDAESDKEEVEDDEDEDDMVIIDKGDLEAGNVLVMKAEGVEDGEEDMDIEEEVEEVEIE